MATYSANQPPSVGIALTAFLPPSNTTVSTENGLPPELLQTLVSTVTAEVTNQLSCFTIWLSSYEQRPAYILLC
jgi:hypothetical protein